MLELCKHYANHVGIVGVLLTLIAYLLLNIEKVKSVDLSYLFLNLIGSIMLFFSLLFYWNLSSVLIELAWISISLMGIFRVYRS